MRTPARFPASEGNGYLIILKPMLERRIWNQICLILCSEMLLKISANVKYPSVFTKIIKIFAERTLCNQPQRNKEHLNGA